MPTYEYSCRDCGEPLEVVQSIHDDSLTTCPSCGGNLRKLFGNVGVVFKGSGFYKNDSRSTKSSTDAPKRDAKKSDGSSEGKGTDAAKKSGDSGSAGGTGTSDSKSSDSAKSSAPSTSTGSTTKK